MERRERAEAIETQPLANFAFPPGTDPIGEAIEEHVP